MSVITEIRDVRGQIVVCADGSPVLRVAKKHYAQRPLTLGEDVDVESYADSIAALQQNDAYEAALTCLDFSERTAGELIRALTRKGFVAPAAEAAVARLVENGIVDDLRYARRIAESASKKPVGRYALRRKLMAKGVGEADVEDALEALGTEQQLAAAKEAAAKLGRKYASLPPREARAKLSQALARRGFSWDVISSALDDLTEDE